MYCHWSFKQVQARGGKILSIAELVTHCGPPLVLTIDRGKKLRGEYTDGSFGVSVIFRKDGMVEIPGGVSYIWND